MCLAERARPRAQQAPSGPTRWIFTDVSLALDAAAPEDGRAPLTKQTVIPDCGFGVPSSPPFYIKARFKP